jgi:hypothetical protein
MIQTVNHFLSFSPRQAVMLSCINCMIVTESMYFASSRSLMFYRAELKPYSQVSIAFGSCDIISK